VLRPPGAVAAAGAPYLAESFPASARATFCADSMGGAALGGCVTQLANSSGAAAMRRCGANPNEPAGAGCAANLLGGATVLSAVHAP
jgi:hypothetical protein